MAINFANFHHHVCFILISRSFFKPFIFVPNITQLLKSTSPAFGPEDPVKKKPRFQTKPDRRHDLYKKHESAVVMMETCQVR